MGFRFRKSIRLFPGVRLNFGKSSSSISVGPRWLRYTVGPKGNRVTAGIPGTGLSWTEYLPKAQPRSSGDDYDDQEINYPKPVVQVHDVPIERVGQISTSDLALTLDRVHRRLGIARLFATLAVALLVAALMTDKPLFGVLAIGTSLFIPFAIFLDRYRRSVSIKYRECEAKTRIAAALAESFKDLRACERAWSVGASAKTFDWKRNAGANQLVVRRPAKFTMGRPRCIRGRIAFPNICAGSNSFYFLPDAMLVANAKSITALLYQDFSMAIGCTRFIESERVPADTQVVGQTWRYVNKQGGPDRRFKFNKQVPVCIYGEMAINSPSGLSSLVQFSNPSAGDRFGKVIDVLRGLDKALIKDTSISAVELPRRWPAVVLILVYLVSMIGILLVEGQSAFR